MMFGNIWASFYLAYLLLYDWIFMKFFLAGCFLGT